MRLRFLLAALAAAVGLLALPACKKTKPTTADSPTPNTPQPGPGPGSNTSGGRDPGAPTSPVFGASSPFAAAMRAPAENNVKQIVLGMHNFHDANNAFPAGYADKTGKLGLSWRVALLPSIGQAPLLQQFKLDEPWDSEHNKKLITMMPAVYAPPKQNTYGYTFIRGFTGANTWLPPQPQPGRAGQLLLGAKFAQFSDGTSNTFLVAEAYDPVIWTKPDEMQFAPGNVPKLGGVFASGTMVGMADGSVRFIRPGVDTKEIAKAIQINDGEIVMLD